VLGLLSLPVSVFGLQQLASTLVDQLSGPAQVTDFLAYYSAAHLLLHDARHVYDPTAQQALQHQLLAGGAAYVPFVSPPQVPLLQAVLGLLPFGLAYLVWTALGVVCLAAAAWLLAPGRAASSSRWLLWLGALPLFVPVLFGLIMGQSSALMLLGFSVFARLSLDAGKLRGGLALLSWSLKPNLLPAHVVALACTRRWRTLSLYGLGVLALAAAALAIMGGDGVRGLITASTTRIEVAAARPDGYPEGFTFLPIAQALLGVGDGVDPARKRAELCSCRLGLAGRFRSGCARAPAAGTFAHGGDARLNARRRVRIDNMAR
jgi:hypothetical protein